MRTNLSVGNASKSSGRSRGTWFERLAFSTAHLTGKPTTFLLALVVLVVWCITGPIFKFSDTWQLVINTGTSVVTFLMVFLIQATQNRDTLALQLKLDELIVATRKARNQFAGIEDECERELEQRKEQFRAEKTRE
jgi:low affinity Fe/Cu permease